ncbi:MAG: glycosyltransferase family 2 protein [Pseudomonadota bacterium]
MEDITTIALETQERYGVLDLSIIVPTYNEADNIEELVRRLDSTLAGTSWEVVFVDDDSSDGTHEIVRELAQRDRRVRVLRRIGRRGLSSACVEGMLSTSAPILAVMDADLQHDETVLPQMLAEIQTGDYDLVVGSRYVSGGGLGDWDERRAAISRFSNWLARQVTKVQLADPMSGFFMIRREVLGEVIKDLSGVGFKLLLDILASSERPLKCAEVPYTFRSRQAGQSKLDNAVALDFGVMLLEKTVGRYVPVKFIMFSLVGGTGLIVHLTALGIIHKMVGINFVVSQTVATLIAITFNFFMNNAFTFRDQQLKGWSIIRGWLSFTFACSVGAFANIGVAVYLFDIFSGQVSLLWIWSAVAGALVGAVWNYAVTAVYTWGNRK